MDTDSFSSDRSASSEAAKADAAYGAIQALDSAIKCIESEFGKNAALKEREAQTALYSAFPQFLTRLPPALIQWLNNQPGPPLREDFTREQVIDALEYLAANTLAASKLLGGHVPSICALAASWLRDGGDAAAHPLPDAWMEEAERMVAELTLQCETFWWNDGPEGKPAQPMKDAKAALLAHIRARPLNDSPEEPR